MLRRTSKGTGDSIRNPPTRRAPGTRPPTFSGLLGVKWSQLSEERRMSNQAETLQANPRGPKPFENMRNYNPYESSPLWRKSVNKKNLRTIRITSEVLDDPIISRLYHTVREWKTMVVGERKYTYKKFDNGSELISEWSPYPIRLVPCQHRVFEGSLKATWRTVTVWHTEREATQCFFKETHR